MKRSRNFFLSNANKFYLCRHFKCFFRKYLTLREGEESCPHGPCLVQYWWRWSLWTTCNFIFQEVSKQSTVFKWSLPSKKGSHLSPGPDGALSSMLGKLVQELGEDDPGDNLSLCVCLDRHRKSRLPSFWWLLLLGTHKPHLLLL